MCALPKHATGGNWMEEPCPNLALLISYPLRYKWYTQKIKTVFQRGYEKIFLSTTLTEEKNDISPEAS